MSINLSRTLAGCATASTTAKTAEATEQTTGRYLLEIDRSNDQSSDRSNFAVDRFYNSAHCTSIAGINYFEFQIGRFFKLVTKRDRECYLSD